MNTRNLSIRVLAFLVSLIAAMCGSASAQEDPTGLANGDMETARDSGEPEGWLFVSRPAGQKHSVILDPDDSFVGERSAFIDASEGRNEFTNLMQSFDATEYQGQRQRFRAAVKTADLAINTKVQLWFRVDCESESGEREMGAFDNMGDRPIDSDEWTHFDVVLDVAENAKSLNVGMFVIGNGKAWIDDVSLTAVDEDTATTGGAATGAAFSKASSAPTQPFYNHWLWLALLTVVLLFWSQLSRPRIELDESDLDQDHGIEWDDLPPVGWASKFALRFSVIYWLLYCLPTPFSSLIPPQWSQPLFAAYENVSDQVVRWTGSDVFGIQEALVAPNGSGDTTYAYIKLLVGFALAFTVAILWSLVDRRRTNCHVTHDLLRSFLRYVLAITMLGYGLAKVGMIPGQFPPPGEYHLSRTYGESSPMGLLWTFMGASLAYTNFAGLGEVIGGLLLIFRRTTTLGAMVVFAVMLNVMMLNFCYDVPVKQYSAHLVCMALSLMLPDIGRLFNLLLFNRPTDPVSFRPPYTGPKTIWIHRVIKVAVIVVAIAMPIGSKIYAEFERANEPQAKRAVDEKYLLLNRGYRWINEVPFNR